MGDSLRVVAVAGRMIRDIDHPGKFVGVERSRVAVPACEEHSRVGDVAQYVATGPVNVPNTVHYRRALARGDIALASEAAPEPKASKASKATDK